MKIRIAALAVAATASLSVAATPASAADYPMTSNVYGKRYCEMAVAYILQTGLHVDVYNTFGLNDCPTADWTAATTETALTGYINAFGAYGVRINGPRWWAFDSIGGVLGDTAYFGAIGMRKAAVITSVPEDFKPLIVQRTSTWVYNKGTYMRILTAPDRHRYAMQSWTTQVNNTLKASNINSINSGKKPLLKLPTGWKWKAVRATKKTTVVAPGTMTILRDNLQNVYSLIS